MFKAGPPQGAIAPLAGQALARTNNAVLTPSSSQLGQRDWLRQTAGAADPSGGRELRAANNRGGKIQRQAVHGVLLLDKPLGLSSNQALQRAKWLLRAEKAGHTGTLDPLATGVLPLCFGAATKFSQVQLDADKTYEATVVLGQKTTTADAEGDVIETRRVPAITAQLLDELTRRFTGPLAQIPPLYSALKKDGKALYEYARKGEDVAREARHIIIYKLNLSLAEQTRAQPAIKMIVTCSKGTYIRTLGEDIGEAIGCGAHLGSLRRIETGGFTQGDCITLTELEALGEDQRQARLLPPQILIAASPSITLGRDDAGRFLSGLRRRGTPGQWGTDVPLVQVFGPVPDGQAGHPLNDGTVFLGSGHVTADELIPQRLLSPIEVSQLVQARAQTLDGQGDINSTPSLIPAS